MEKIHTADIYLPGNRHGQRAINMLYSMELHDGENDRSDKENEKLQSRPQGAGHIEDRKAALIAKERISKSMLLLFYLLLLKSFIFLCGWSVINMSYIYIMPLVCLY